MRKNHVIVLIFIGIVAVTASYSGCLKKSPGPTAEVSTGTCAQLGGYICNETQDCNGTWLDANDTFRCCSCECGQLTYESLVPDTFDEPTDDALEDIT